MRRANDYLYLLNWLQRSFFLQPRYLTKWSHVMLGHFREENHHQFWE